MSKFIKLNNIHDDNIINLDKVTEVTLSKNALTITFYFDCTSDADGVNCCMWQCVDTAEMAHVLSHLDALEL